MIEISLKEIQKYYGANKILDNLTFEVQTGERTGLIGNNGTGKTTVFKIIADLENYDGGMLMLRKSASVGYLDQMPAYPEGFEVADVLNSAFAELHKLNDEIKELEKKMSENTGHALDIIMKKYSGAIHNFEHLGGYEIEDKINKICSGLKIDTSMRNRLFDKLSGGEKTRVILGRILLQNPDILLLDEPTNHLDLESLEWLEDFLVQYKGTILIVSHDRYFLDRVTTRTIEIEDGEAIAYYGNYSYYVQEKERLLQEQFEDYKDQQKKIKEMEKSIKMFMEWGDRGDNPKFHRKAASIQKRLDKMDKIQRPQMESAKIQLNFSKSDRSGKEVIVLKEVSKVFDNRVLFSNINLRIEFGEKIAMIGKNGCGKSTLMKIILGECLQDSGEVILGTNLNIGYLEQNIIFNDENNTLIQEFRASYACSEGQARGILAKFLFYGGDVFKQVKNLSGGEKSRLKLCQLMHQDINLLLLDEPTNHLDIESREMLEDALDNFKGTIMLISHDRYFLNKIAEKIYNFTRDNLEPYLGNYDYYKEKCLEKEKQTSLEFQKEKPVKQEIKKPRIPLVDPTKKEKEKLETSIAQLETQIKALEEELSQNSNNYAQLTAIFSEKESLQQLLDTTLEKWLSLP